MYVRAALHLLCFTSRGPYWCTVAQDKANVRPLHHLYGKPVPCTPQSQPGVCPPVSVFSCDSTTGARSPWKKMGKNYSAHCFLGLSYPSLNNSVLFLLSELVAAGSQKTLLKGMFHILKHGRPLQTHCCTMIGCHLYYFSIQTWSCDPYSGKVLHKCNRNFTWIKAAISASLVLSRH